MKPDTSDLAYPLVSIITAAYNRLNYIKETILSVFIKITSISNTLYWKMIDSEGNTIEIVRTYDYNY
jgi:hypothetical protein